MLKNEDSDKSIDNNDNESNYDDEIESGAVAYSSKKSKASAKKDIIEESTDKDFEEDQEYEKIKQDLLKEYSSIESSLNTQESSEEESVDDQNEFNPEDMLEESGSHEEEFDPEDMLEESGSHEEEFNPEDVIKEHKNSSNNVHDDEDTLEVDDVEKDLDGDVIDDSTPLNSNAEKVTPEVDQGISKVAVSKGSSIIIMVGFILLFIYIIYQMIQPDAEEVAPKPTSIDKSKPIVQPIPANIGQNIVVPEIPKFPDIPKPIPAAAPKALPTPPLPPMMDISPIAPPPPPLPGSVNGGVPPLSGAVAQNLNQVAVASDSKADERKKARLKSSMMAKSGGGGGKNKGDLSSKGQSLTKLEKNNNKIVATYIGELQRIVAEGKVIDAVLETAINTDLPGMVRAVVSRDVYSEAGTNILINRGSRIIGTYSSQISFGQARVQISWNRVIRPDGVDIAIASPSIDDIGRAGTPGDVDNHILRNMQTTMMMTMFNVAIGAYADKNTTVDLSSTTSTTTTDPTTGATTQSSTSGTQDNETQAWQDGLNSLSKINSDVVGKTMNLPPTITIDQGTPLKVFVKTDLFFPGTSANLTRMIE